MIGDFMKKRIIIIAIIVVLLGVGILGFILIKNNSKKEKVNDYSEITFLNIDGLKEKIDDKDSFILIISKDNCSHCISYLPVANKVAKEYGIKFYDISTTNLNDEEKTYLRNIANISGTPTTIFIINGEEKSTNNRLVGEVKEYRLVEKLKAMGYIDEEDN